MCSAAHGRQPKRWSVLRRCTSHPRRTDGVLRKGVYMSVPNWFCGLGLVLLPVAGVLAVTHTEKVRNEKVLVVEQTLAPGETMSWPADHAGVTVYFDDGSIEVTPAQGSSRTETVQRGQAVFRPPQAETVKNAGSSALRVVRTDRKSTRLNSSHRCISYAVFCL